MAKTGKTNRTISDAQWKSLRDQGMTGQEIHAAVANGSLTGQNANSYKYTPGGNGGSGGPAGMGGYTPSQAVQDTLTGVKTGAYNKNPVEYDPNASYIKPEGGPLSYNDWIADSGAVARDHSEEKALRDRYQNEYVAGYNAKLAQDEENWNKEQAAKRDAYYQWEADREKYANNLGYKYIADKAAENKFSDDDLVYIARMLDSDPQFANIENAFGEKIAPSQAFSDFYYGENQGPIEGGGYAYSGGYKDVLDNRANEKAPSQQEWDNMNDDEKILYDATQTYRGKYRQYMERYKQEKTDVPFEQYMQRAMELDSEFATAAEAIEDAHKALGTGKPNTNSGPLTEDDIVKQALEASNEYRNAPEVNQLETALGMADNPEQADEISRRLYELTGDKKYNPPSSAQWQWRPFLKHDAKKAAKEAGYKHKWDKGYYDFINEYMQNPENLW